jgi:hypothetical protein
MKAFPPRSLCPSCGALTANLPFAAVFEGMELLRGNHEEDAEGA